MTASGQSSATPILDLDAPLPPARDERFTRNETVGIIAFFALGIAVPVFAARYVQQEAPGQWTGDFPFFLSLIFLGVPVIWLILTAIHETGHVVAGLALGFQFRALEIGSLRIAQNGRRWRLRSARPFRPIVGGGAEMGLDRIWRVRKRLILLYAGGLPATIPVAIVVFVFGAHATGPVTLLTALIFGACWVMHVLLSVIPMRPDPGWEGANDFAYLQALFTSKEDARQLVAGAVLHMLRNREIDELRWNPRWIRMAYPTADRDEWLAYRSADNPSVIAEQLEQWLAASGRYRAEERDGLILEAAYFTAWHRDDAARADVWFGRVTRMESVGRYRRIRTEVAVRCAHRQFQEALDCWQLGLEILQSLSAPWVRPLEGEWRNWRTEIEKRRTECGVIVTPPN